VIVNGRRLWIDSHVHAYAEMLEGGRIVFHADALSDVMRADAADLVWILSDARPDYGQLNSRPADFVRLLNEAMLELVGLMPADRVFGSIAVHPGAVDESLEAIDVYAGEHGFPQVGEILGYALGFDLDTPEMVAIARHAARRGLPLECHCSTTGQPEGEQIRQTISLARQVPEAKVIAAHAIGGGNSWLHITAAEVYFDLGGENLWLEIRDLNTRGYLRAAVSRLGAERLIVGTDWMASGKPPYLPYGILFHVEPDQMPYPSCAASLEGFLRESGCSDQDVDRIAAANSIELFGLEGRLGL